MSATSGNYVGMYKSIVKYDSDKDHYYLIAPTHNRAVNNYPANMLGGAYDLYKFDGNAADGLEWKNYKTESFNLERGKGYLYSRNVSYTLMFAGSVLPVGEHTIENLTYGSNTETNPFLNWNLVGNPFPCNAYLSGNRQFYRLVETAEGSRIVLATDNVIKPMEGVFVQAAIAEESSVTFTAKTTDYASRFRVVFAAAGAGGDDSDPSFAFNNNGQWLILNEGRATLQVIDQMGRVLSSELIEDSVSKNIQAAPGIYMIRLVNGDNVKVQKVVVRKKDAKTARREPTAQAAGSLFINNKSTSHPKFLRIFAA